MTERDKQKLIDIEPAWFETCFDFDIPDGWKNLIESILLKAKELGFQPHEIKIAQIKNKWGGLRFYADIAESLIGRNQRVDELNAYINLAESESFIICSTCGGYESGYDNQGVYHSKFVCSCKVPNKLEKNFKNLGSDAGIIKIK